MAGGQFLSELSSGIFGRQGELRKQQEGRDESRRGEVLNLLAGLADKVEPESLPLLMGHLGDVMKLQGPMKKFWSAFSGMPDRGFEDQLGTKLKGVLDTAVGPDKAKSVRTGGDLARLFQPQTPFSSTPEQAANKESMLGAEKDLSRNLVFRDPRREKLEELQTRFQGQNELQADRLNTQNYFQNLRQEDRQRHDQEMVGVKSDAKAQEDINERAWVIATQKGFPRPNTALKAQAASQLAKEQGWTNEKLQAQIGFLKARTAESEATAMSLKETGGLRPSDVDRRQKNFLTAQENLTKSEGSMKGIRENQSKLENQINTLLNVYRGYKFKYDPANGKVIVEQYPPEVSDEQLKAITSLAAKRAGTQIGDYRKLEDRMKEEEGKSEGYRKSVEEYDRSRAKPPIKPERPSKPLPRAGLTTEKNLIRFRPVEGRDYEPGVTKVTQRGRSYIVVGFDPDGTVLAKPVQ